MAETSTRWWTRRRPGAGAADVAEPDTNAHGAADVQVETDADAPAANPATPPAAPGPRTRFGTWLGKPMTSFHLIVAIAALLVSLGLIMVLSASGVHSYDEDGSPWVIFAKQVLWTIIGLFAFYIACLLYTSDAADEL